MSARLKSVLLLCGVLVVGLLLGAFATSTWQHRRMSELRQAREQGGIMRMLEQTIEFESDTQRQEVEEILQRTEESFRSLRRMYLDSMVTHRELLMNDMQQVLTPEQLEDMQERLTRERRSNRSRGRRDGPRKRPQSKP